LERALAAGRAMAAMRSVSRSLAIDPRRNNRKQYEYHVNALLFLKDAEALGQRQSVGQFVLLMHAIELALKSFLHGKDSTMYNLEMLESKFRHDLNNLLMEATSAGLIPSDSDTYLLVSCLNEYTHHAMIRYQFNFTMPLVEDVLRVTRALINDTQPTLPEAAPALGG
jgi:hypothetical protein